MPFSSPTALRRLPATALRAWESVPPGRWAVGLALLTLAVLAALLPGRTPVGEVWGDEGTFLAMTESLALDRDLRFDGRDLERVRSLEGGRTHLILQRAGDDAVAYSKPVVYPLLAAPFWPLFGEAAPVVLNVLAFGLALLLARAYLRRLARRDGVDPGRATLTLVSFVCAAVVIPYVAWRMADLFQLCLALAGLVLLLARQRSDEAPSGLWERMIVHPAAPFVGSALLAVLVGLRVTNGLIALLPVLVAAWQRRWRRALAFALVLVAVILGLQQLSQALTGAANPYRAVRASFTAETGYPLAASETTGTDARPDPSRRFDENRASHGTRVETPATARQVAYSALYFFVGRHTGLLLYFPAALLLLWLGVRRGDAPGRWALVVCAGTVAFFVGWKPINYFGGETFLGNRYFLSAYPLLLLSLRRLPSPRAWLGVWLVAALAYGSAAVSVARTHDVDRTSQNHAYAGVYRLLPYESTARSLDGRRDRYWSDAFVRFVDPYARVNGRRFTLRSGAPPAEILVASYHRPESLTFDLLLPRSSEPEPLRLHVSDWAEHATFAIGGAEATEIRGAAGEPLLLTRIEMQPSTPWRRHRFWFGDRALFWVTALRLELDAAEPGVEDGVETDVFFVGQPRRLARAMARELRSWHLVDEPVAGRSGELSLAVENTSPTSWDDGDVTAVTLRWLLRRDGEVVAESGRLELPAAVAPGSTADLRLPIRWPETPGLYELEVDLVLERVAWFQEAVGEPLLRREVRVVAAPGH